MSHRRCLALLCFLAFCSGLLLIPHHVSAVTCVNPDVKGQASAWANGVTVVVNVSGFAAALQPCIKTAFDNWNAASIDNGSNVLLHVQYGTPLNTTGQNNIWQVTQQTPAPNPTTGEPRAGSTGGQTNGTNRVNATTSIDPNITNCTALTETTAHEIGHTFGLGECTNCNAPQQSVMIGIPCAQRDPTTGKCIALDLNNTTFGLPGPTTCDNTTINNSIYPPPPPPPPPPPQDCTTCDFSCCVSPILIDTTGQGFFLTDAQHGVVFDIRGTGKPIQVAWTASGANNAFLCLPDGNGKCDDGKDLFGNFTPQPLSATPNGFAALAVYDQPAYGGNGDGVIDARDAVFSSLRLWIDRNHDGISQADEMYTLPQLGVNSISLNYWESRRTDQYGNVFRFTAKINVDDPDESPVGRKAYDILLHILNNSAAKNAKCPVYSVIPQRTGGF